MDHELSSLLKMFQNLCCTGKRATLSFSCENGKASVNLNVDVGELKPALEYPPPVTPTHVSPLRKRRTLKRAEARRLFAEEAIENLSREEQDVLTLAAKAENFNYEAAPVAINGDDMALDNRAQTNSDMQMDVDNKLPTDETEEVDPEEAKRDRMVEKVVIYRVSGGSLFKPRQTNDEVKKEVIDKLAMMGVEVIEFSGHADRDGMYETGVVSISPVNLNKIWGRRLGLTNCSVIAYEKPPWKK